MPDRPVHPEQFSRACDRMHILIAGPRDGTFMIPHEARVILSTWHGGFWRMLAALAWDRIRIRLIYWRDDAAHALHRDAWAHPDCPACSVLATECEELADAILEHVRHD